jgi:hypothetical protein
MTSWLFAQTLYEVAKMPIAPTTMFTDDPSNKSVWNGAMYYQGLSHQTVGKPPKYAGFKPSKDDRALVRQFEQDLMAECRQRVHNQEFLSYFTLETHLCQFKKLNVGHDYPGQNIADATVRYHKFVEKWPEVDFSAFREAVDTKLYKEIAWKCESKELYWLFNKTGQLINMNQVFPELPDMYLELGLDPDFFDTVDKKKERTVKKKIIEYEKKIYGSA